MSRRRQDRRFRNLSTRGPWILFAVVLALSITLTVLWHVTLVNEYRKLRELAQDQPFQWKLMILGSVLFLSIIVLSSVLSAQLIGHIRWSQRQSNFIASVSHELNSPLSSIKLFAQTLRHPQMSTADRLDFIEKILFDVERLKRLIANILRAAELDNREVLIIAKQRVELFEYLETFCEDTRTLRREDKLEISLEGPRPVPIDLDPLMFRQVLDNLVDNAIRYRGSSQPKVHLELERKNGGIDVIASDSGIGAPVGELPNLFDRFYRVEEHPGPPGRRGTGIGLFIVRSIVQAHGGQVEAWSEGPGHGMEVRIHFPITAHEGTEATEGIERTADDPQTDGADTAPTTETATTETAMTEGRGERA